MHKGMGSKAAHLGAQGTAEEAPRIFHQLRLRSNGAGQLNTMQQRLSPP
jgi:hypothetical protein